MSKSYCQAITLAGLDAKNARPGNFCRHPVPPRRARGLGWRAAIRHIKWTVRRIGTLMDTKMLKCFTEYQSCSGDLYVAAL